MPTQPFHRILEAFFVSTLRDKVKEIVGAVDQVNATLEAGISVKRLARFVPEEDADPLLLDVVIGRAP